MHVHPEAGLPTQRVAQRGGQLAVAVVRSRAAAGKDVLFFGLARVAQMNVHIDKPRSRNQTVRADFACTLGKRQAAADFCNLSVGKQNVPVKIGAGSRVDDAG